MVQETKLRLQDDERLKTVILAARWPLYVEGRDVPNQGSKPFLLTASLPDSLSAAPKTSDNAGVVQDTLEQLIVELHKAGKQVILLGPVPEMDEQPRLRAIKARLFGYAEMTDPTRAAVEARQARSDAILRDLAARTGAAYLPITPSMCGETCPTRDGDTLFYFDFDHLSEAGAS